jgi:hypothetical protein
MQQIYRAIGKAIERSIKGAAQQGRELAVMPIMKLPEILVHLLAVCARVAITLPSIDGMTSSRQTCLDHRMAECGIGDPGKRAELDQHAGFRGTHEPMRKRDVRPPSAERAEASRVPKEGIKSRIDELRQTSRSLGGQPNAVASEVKHLGAQNVAFAPQLASQPLCSLSRNGLAVKLGGDGCAIPRQPIDFALGFSELWAQHVDRCLRCFGDLVEFGHRRLGPCKSGLRRGLLDRCRLCGARRRGIVLARREHHARAHLYPLRLLTRLAQDRLLRGLRLGRHYRMGRDCPAG